MLGHHISKEGLRIDRRKLSFQVENLCNIDKGYFNFFRRFIGCEISVTCAYFKI